jgi:hypothetical protein
VQGDRGFNTLGQLEIPEQALEELLVNALIPRDYFTSASIRLMVFANRVEIISPRHLPDSLSTDSIRHGATNRRNPTLTEHAVNILPYCGLGTGITRALQDWPNIELIDDVAANQFRVVVRRPASQAITPQVTPQVTGEVRRLLAAIQGEMKRAEIQAALGFSDRKHFRDAYLHPAQANGFIEMTIPDAPNSRQQGYRLTAMGKAFLANRNPARGPVQRKPGYLRPEPL